MVMSSGNRKWKRNVRKIPDEINAKLASMRASDVITAVVKRVSLSEIAAGVYAHLGLRVEGDTPIAPVRVLPPQRMGKYSRMNVEGRNVVHKDRPKVRKTYEWEAPDWGGYGTHTCWGDRYVYQREFIPPQRIHLRVDILAQEVAGSDVVLCKVQVDRVLDAKSPTFEGDLLHNLNLLQENVGAANVFAANATREEFIASAYLHVSWEILPPGTKEQIIAKVLARMPQASDALRRVVAERYDLLNDLGPRAWVRGERGFKGYFGAMFADDLVVFENLLQGNAMYIMFENWRDLSQKNKQDLLCDRSAGYIRVVHLGAWEDRVRDLVLFEKAKRVG